MAESGKCKTGKIEPEHDHQRIENADLVQRNKRTERIQPVQAGSNDNSLTHADCEIIESKARISMHKAAEQLLQIPSEIYHLRIVLRLGIRDPDKRTPGQQKRQK